MPDDTPDVIADRYRSRVKAIKADLDLTDEARRRLLDQAKSEADAGRREVRAADRAEADEQRAALVRRMFGRPGIPGGAGVAADRDAFDRAKSITTPQAAVEALRLAEVVGDESMIRALGAQSLDRARAERDTPGRVRARSRDGADWESVLISYAEHTGTTADLAELDKIDEVGVSRASRMQNKIMEDMRVSAVRDDVADPSVRRDQQRREREGVGGRVEPPERVSWRPFGRQ